MRNYSSEKVREEKRLPLCLVSFFLAFNYFILKALKETLLVTAKGAGAEAIPFVKMWLLFPFSVLFLALFTWLTKRFSFRFAVSSVIVFFLTSYGIFTFVLFPFHERLHLHVAANHLQQILPLGWGGLAAVIRYWSFSLFYVSTECWCTLVYSVVFWGYVNTVVNFDEAKRTYPYLTLAGTLAALFAGPLTLFVTGDQLKKWIPAGYDPWNAAFYALILSVLISGFLAVGIFLKKCPRESMQTFRERDRKTSFWNMFFQLLRSKYLVTLLIMCLCYNLVINLTDVLWKNEVLALCPDPSSFTAYLSYVTILTGVIATIFTLGFSRQSLKRFGWTTTALFTPLIALISACLFFFAFFGKHFAIIPFSLSTVAFLGSLHIVFSSAGKYTLFEPTKEMAYLPLSSEEKLHGKAVIDGLGARLGKTTSSMIYQLLLIVFPTITSCGPAVSVIMFTCCLLCIHCILTLGRQIEATPIEA